MGMHTNQLSLHGTPEKVLWKENDVGMFVGFVFFQESQHFMWKEDTEC